MVNLGRENDAKLEGNHAPGHVRYIILRARNWYPQGILDSVKRD